MFLVVYPPVMIGNKTWLAGNPPFLWRFLSLGRLSMGGFFITTFDYWRVQIEYVDICGIVRVKFSWYTILTYLL